MYPEISPRQWSAALRSGDYKQAKNRLCTEKGFCCLGVYAKKRGVKFHPRERVDFLEDTPLPEIPELLLKQDFPSEILVDMKAKKLGPGDPKSFIAMNDSYGWTFAQIADFIDTYIDDDWEWVL